MIIVVGLPRTGTSVLVQCLKNSGFNAGKEEYLIGEKYKSELAFFKHIHMSLLQKKGRVLKFYDKDALRRHELQTISAVQEFIADNNINVLKDLYSTPFYKLHKDRFKSIKFIWAKRNIIEATKSMLRLQEQLGSVSQTFEKQYELNMMYNKMHEDLFKRYERNYVEVWHEDLLESPDEAKQELSEYLDHDIDLSIISKEETWQAKQIPQ